MNVYVYQNSGGHLGNLYFSVHKMNAIAVLRLVGLILEENSMIASVDEFGLLRGRCFQFTEISEGCVIWNVFHLKPNKRVFRFISTLSNMIYLHRI